MLCEANQFLLKIQILLHNLLKKKQFRIYIELVQFWWHPRLGRGKMSGARNQSHLVVLQDAESALHPRLLRMSLARPFSKISQVLRSAGMAKP